MKSDKVIARARKLSRPYRITRGARFRLEDFDPGDTGDFTVEDKPRAVSALQSGVEALTRLQDVLYAYDRWSVLLIFQAMDAAGKDSAIKHVMSGVNPQGCEVHSFKAPSPEELDHDFMWRCMARVPPRGRIGIFNRSYYEEVLVVRVHDEILRSQKLPPPLVAKHIFKDRCHDIQHTERYLARNGVAICKFFLHVSKKRQKERLLERIDKPEKNWKVSAADGRERAYWDGYMKAYEDAIQRTATGHAPWYVVPADHKWFTRLVVASAVVDTLAGLDLRYPEVDAAKRKELAAAKRALLGGA
jgi:PPK2 family polyphosphate:nucleotide phosphotransferase